MKVYRNIVDAIGYRLKEDGTLVRNPNKTKNNDIQFMQIHGRIQAIEQKINIGTKTVKN